MRNNGKHPRRKAGDAQSEKIWNRAKTDIIWRNIVRKNYLLFTVIVMIALCFSGCGKSQYTEDEIIGLTSFEIVEKYGDFDRKQGSPGEDGLYRDCACGYLISEKQVGFLELPRPNVS